MPRNKRETPGKRIILDKIVLEQVFLTIPEGVRACLMRNGPTPLNQAAAYLENYFLAERSLVRWGGGLQSVVSAGVRTGYW